MYASNFFENMVLNTFNNVTALAPSNVYVGLFLSNPTETGTAGNEISYGGYNRAKITFTEPYAESGGIGFKNDSDITFEKSNDDAGIVRYIGIFDSEIKGSGNMYLYGELTTPLEIKSGQQPLISAGDILYYSTGTFSVYFKTKMLNLLRNQNLLGFTPYLSLFNGDPEASGTELTGDGYERPEIVFTSPEEQPSGQMAIENATIIKFSSPKSAWGNWAYDGIKDAKASGNLILKSENPSPEIIQKNYVPQAQAGDYKVMIN